MPTLGPVEAEAVVAENSRAGQRGSQLLGFAPAAGPGGGGLSADAGLGPAGYPPFFDQPVLLELGIALLPTFSLLRIVELKVLNFIPPDQ